MPEEWSQTPPTEPGHYWFHGWRNARYKGEAAETGLCRAFLTGNKRLTFVMDGHFMYLSECEGVWMPAVLPKPPAEPARWECPGCGRPTNVIFNHANCPACAGRD